MNVDKDIMRLKAVIQDAFIGLTQSNRAHFKAALLNMFHKPLVRFNDAYEVFIKTIASESESLDGWINLQLQITTDLGEHREVILDTFKTTFLGILQQTPGGEVGYFNKADMDAGSYTLALALRVYGEQLRMESDVKK